MRTSLRSLLLLLTLFCSACGQQTTITGRCVATTDGDTIKVLLADHKLIRVRVAWMDAPELAQPWGYRAKQAMSKLVFGKEVELKPHAIDKYGRTVAMVFVGGVDAGLELVKSGLAWKYDFFLPEAPYDVQLAYRAAEQTAVVARSGLWADPNPIAPWNWRRMHKANATAIKQWGER